MSPDPPTGPLPSPLHRCSWAKVGQRNCSPILKNTIRNEDSTRSHKIRETLQSHVFYHQVEWWEHIRRDERGTWNVFRSEKRRPKALIVSAAEWDNHRNKAEADSLVLVQVLTGQKIHTGPLGTEELRAVSKAACHWHHLLAGQVPSVNSIIGKGPWRTSLESSGLKAKNITNVSYCLHYSQVPPQ